jgi:hypothetical protein
MADFKKKKKTETYSMPMSYTIPPLNQKELKGLIIDILLKDDFRPPFDSLTLFRHIKRTFRNIDYSSFVMSKLKINDIIRDLIEAKIITYEEMYINMKRAYYIKSIDLDKLKIYNNNLIDCELNNDLDKYLEKAKNIMFECLKETKQDFDGDDILINNPYELEYNYLNNKRQRLDGKVGKMTRQDSSTNNVVQEDNYEMNPEDNPDEENDDQNFINSMLYAPTAKVMMNSSHFSDTNYVINISNNNSTL